MLRSVRLAFAVCLLAVQCLGGAEAPRAVLFWGGGAGYASATVANAMDSRVRRPAEVGKVALPAVFLHPQDQGRAVVEHPPLAENPGHTEAGYL